MCVYICIYIYKYIENFREIYEGINIKVHTAVVTFSSLLRRVHLAPRPKFILMSPSIGKVQPPSCRWCHVMEGWYSGTGNTAGDTRTGISPPRRHRTSGRLGGTVSGEGGEE